MLYIKYTTLNIEYQFFFSDFSSRHTPCIPVCLEITYINDHFLFFDINMFIQIYGKLRIKTLPLGYYVYIIPQGQTTNILENKF